jgi:hypothetical protein
MAPSGARDYQGGEDRRGREGAEALRALGVERIVVTPLRKGWRIEGGADLQ